MSDRDKTPDIKLGKEESWRLYRRLFRYMLPHRLIFGTAMLGYVIFALTSPAATWWLGWTVDAITSGDYEALRIISPLAFIGLAAVRGAGGFMGSYFLASISNHVVHKLRCELIDRLIRLPSSYFDKNSSGRLVSKLTYDVLQITGAASNAVAVAVREGFTVIGLLAYLMYMDWKLSLTFLVIAPVVGKVVSIASKKFRRYSTQMQDSMGDVTQITNETIKGYRVIRTFNAEDYVSTRLSAASEKNRKQNMKMVLTRIGQGARMVVTGDPSQVDLPPRERSGLAHAIDILHNVSTMKVTRFEKGDVVRHPIVAEIVEAYEADLARQNEARDSS